ncbi:MAG: hydrogenase maturation protease [Anaerolineales bacterium]|nr:hydrogenase maturation protease [Anaerolineales bacterium]
MKTIVIGLGNPILGDDGVGWRVAEEVNRLIADSDKPSAIGHQPSAIRPPPSAIEVDCFSLGGLSLMERLTGYERVILIDAIFTGQRPIGSVTTFPLNELPNLSAGHSTAAHDTSLRTALDVGRSMDIPLPEEDQVTIVAIEAENVYDFSEKLSPPVEAAVPLAVAKVMELLNK